MKNVLKLWQYIPDWGIDKLKFLEQISIPGPIEFPYRAASWLKSAILFLLLREIWLISKRQIIFQI